MVRGLRILVKIVLRPVAIVSEDSRVVALTEVKRPISSSMLPPAALNAAPVLRNAKIMSSDSTANLPATALIEPSFCSSLSTLTPKTAIAAIAPSAVFSISLKVGASEDLANASKAVLVSLALMPVCAKIRDIFTSSEAATPNVVDSRVISELRPLSCCILLPVT